ncbi:MAG: hypothetical protein KGJ79_17245 [Alphaproteobacteria bacterium]|nr:hypothetical protein [Alphaproteobacteria bacterium]MDE2495449.1 hypothetical protein [Alphaproteobacteria bacterium]
MWGLRHKKLAVALTCADWRLHQRKVDLNNRLARLLGVHGVDVVAVPGPDGLTKPERSTEWQATVGQIKLLVGAHAPRALVVAAHQRCAGHPVSDIEHEADVLVTAKALKVGTRFDGPVRAVLAVYRSETVWDLKAIGEF